MSSFGDMHVSPCPASPAMHAVHRPRSANKNRRSSSFTDQSVSLTANSSRAQTPFSGQPPASPSHLAMENDYDDILISRFALPDIHSVGSCEQQFDEKKHNSDDAIRVADYETASLLANVEWRQPLDGKHSKAAANSFERDGRVSREGSLNDQYGGHELRKNRSHACTDILGYLLFIGIGLAPFLLINSLWSEIPIFELHLQAGKAIGTVVGTSFQLANIIPFLYVALVSVVSIDDATTCAFLSTLGCATSQFLSFRWQLEMDGWAWGLMAGSFSAGIVGCTSIVVIWSFASRYKPKFTSALSGGLGLSGLLPSLLAIGQKAGPDPVFSVRVYFIIQASIMAISCVCLILVLIMARKFEDSADEKLVGDAEQNFGEADETVLTIAKGEDEEERSEGPSWKLCVMCLYPILIQLATSLAVYFALPGLPPYLMSDPNDLRWVYLVFMIANTLGRVLSSKIPIKLLSPLLAVQLILLVAIIAAAMGLFPSWVGLAVVLPVVFSFSFINGFATTACYLITGNYCSSAQQSSACRIVAVAEQAGSLGGQLLCTGAARLGFFHS